MATTTIIDNRFELAADNALIGQGGMGTVHMGRDTLTDNRVAIKLLKPEIIQQNPEIVERFIREGEALRQLNHPNIVKMVAACESEGNHYLIMEFVSGGSLLDLLDETHKLTVQRGLYIALDLADALTRAHRLNILHRDIKPANVLIADDGTPRLTDFGMARFSDHQITQEGAIVGTLAYLSPEALNRFPGSTCSAGGPGHRRPSPAASSGRRCRSSPRRYSS
jgi:serine/threonine protein kinase